MSSHPRDEDYYTTTSKGGERWDRERLDSYDRRRPTAGDRETVDESEYYYRSERRTQSPRADKRDRSPSRDRRDSPPRRERREPSPRYERREPSPRYERREPSPRYERREPSPRYERRDPSPRYERRSPSPRYERRQPSPRRERVIYAERDRYEVPSRARYRPWDEEQPDRTQEAMVHRPRAEKRDIDIEIQRREYERAQPPPEFERPRFIRRQSSLDTYDRKPMPRYGDVARVTEETIMVPRLRSPPAYDDYEDVRSQARERDRSERAESVRYREREVSRGGRDDRSEYEFEEREEIIEETKNFPKRGKTKMPMRMVNTEVLLKLDYPFEREGETIIILKALHRDHIDEIIQLSQEANSRKSESKTRTVIESLDSDEETVFSRRTEIIKEISPGASPSPTVPRSVREWDVLTQTISATPASSLSLSPTRTIKPQHRARSVSALNKREVIVANLGEESAPIRAGVGALIAPSRDRRRSREIQAEIRALEEEKSVLRGERARPHEMVTITEKDGEVTEIRRAKPAPDPKILRGMLWTLT